MAELPTGTVTFLFTDVEGSTRLWEQHPEQMRAALVRHDAIIEEEVARHHGVVVRPRGEGDSRFAVFARATDAVAAAAAIQVALHAEAWPPETPLRVRLALHTGEADLREGDSYGTTVNRCARLRAIAHGGQTVVSELTEVLARDAIPQEIGLRDLGAHRLADLTQPEQIFQLLHPDLPSDFPPLRSLTALPHNLPLQLTSFIGRERELAELPRLLQTTRLLTLTGSGGAGKTRLALQVAAALVPRYADGVWLAELAPLADHTLVPRTIAAAVGVREVPGQAIYDTLAAALRTKRLLLVLDNCEHLLDACARLAHALLRACANVQVLAASREPLGVEGEVSWRVPSLSAPRVGQISPVEQLIRYEAVLLYVERARSVLPGFSVTAQNATAVARTCTQLDGIPLALELAAARLQGLTVDQVASRLDQRFRLLTRGSRTALPRQQTLRATVDWSYDLLTGPEQRLFARLSVFAGGWTLEAAEAVGAGEQIAPDDVLDLLVRLVEQSLVVADVVADGAERYGLLETIRQYAAEKLHESGEMELVRSRHRDWYLALAARAWSALYGPEETVWLDQLAADHDNLRAALEWCRADAHNAQTALRLAGMLTFLWATRGYVTEGQAQLSAVLAMEGASNFPAVWAWALWGASLLAYYQGNLGEARSLGERALEIRRSLGDQISVIQSLKDLGMTAHEQGDYPAARAFLEEAAARSREAGDEPNTATSLERLGAIAHVTGDLPAAHALYAESLAIRERLGYAWGRAWSFLNLGRVAFDQGDYPAARVLLRDSLALYKVDANQDRLQNLLDACAALAVVQGQPAQAGRVAGAASALREATGMRIAKIDQRVARALVLARQKLGADAFAAAWAEGQAMTVEQAVALAVSVASEKPSS